MILFDFKTDENGNKTEFSLMFLSKEHVKSIYGALLKERNSLNPLIMHHEQNPDDATKEIRLELIRQFEAITELLTKIQPYI